MTERAVSLNHVLYCKRCLHANGDLIYYASCQMHCAVCRSGLVPVDFGTSSQELPSADQVLADPAVSFWLKRALRAALTRDPVDAANEAEILASVLAARCREVLQT